MSEMNAWLGTIDQDNWRQLDACPSCRSANTKSFFTVRNSAYDRCDLCGLVFANPSPSDEVSSELYNSPMYNNYRMLERHNQAKDKYFSSSAYTDQRELARWLLRQGSINSVLDFGCGTGNFLALLRDEFEVTDVNGLELNEESVEIAREQYGLMIATRKEQLPHDKFDAVVLFEVIEHIADVTALMAEVVSFVRPGGYVLVSTPSVDNFIATEHPSVCFHYTAFSHISMLPIAA